VSGRQLGIIFGILGALVLVLLVLNLSGEDRGRSNGDLALAGTIDDETTLIRVFSPDRGDSVRLELIRGNWVANGYPANTAQIQELMEGFAAASSGRVVARSPESHERMGVTEDRARRIEVGSADAPEAVLLVGKSGTDGRYVRIPDEPEVYSVDNEIVTALDMPAVYWRDRQIAAVDTPSISAITIRSSEVEIAMERTPGGWTVDGSPADPTAIDGLLGTLADLQASGFPPDSLVWEFDFEAPDITIEVLGPTGRADPPVLTLLMVGVDGTSDFVAKTARGAYVYALSEMALTPIFLDRATLLGGAE